MSPEPRSSVEWRGDHLVVIDQTLLPERLELRDLRSVEEVVDAIERLVVRGAPAIGVCGAFGVVIGIDQRRPPDIGAARAVLDEVARQITATRPTAINLAWAVARTADAARPGRTPEELRDLALAEALEIHERDRESCRRIGELGRQELAAVTRILTHCNAGRLATTGRGTALAIVYAKVDAGEHIEVFATETRPLLQGARLTAWELADAGVPVTLVTDGSVGAVLASGSAEAVVVGCDRVAANGDTANKIGTYMCALAAKAHGLPFYVAGPISSFDPGIPNGHEIVIELRAADEVRCLGGTVTAPAVDVWNPAFDVTPAGLITAFITDVGIVRPPFGRSVPEAIERGRNQGFR